MHEQIVSWLFEHAMKYNYKQLLHEVTTKHPAVHESKNINQQHSLMLVSFLNLLQECGPLPRITKPIFIHLLQNSVTCYIEAHPSLFSTIKRIDVAMLVCCLNFLWMRAIYYSPNFDARDFENNLTKTFPALSEDSDSGWAKINWMYYLNAEDVSSEELKGIKRTIRTYFSRTRRYFSMRMKERKTRNENDSVMKVWNQMQKVLWDLLDFVKGRLERTALECLVPGDTDWIDYLHSVVGGRSEPELIRALNEIDALRKESEFWLWESSLET